MYENDRATIQKKELSAHVKEKIVFWTDIEGKDDRKHIKTDVGNVSIEHYSVAVRKIRNWMFGMDGLYSNLEKARNIIRVIVM